MSSQGFDPKDLEEICARKPHKYKMNKADYQELGKKSATWFRRYCRRKCVCRRVNSICVYDR